MVLCLRKTMGVYTQEQNRGNQMVSGLRRNVNDGALYILLLLHEYYFHNQIQQNLYPLTATSNQHAETYFCKHTQYIVRDSLRVKFLPVDTIIHAANNQLMDHVQMFDR